LYTSNMTSNWGKKLEKKLNGLADSASKESIQTLANWVAFNRKHATIIATVLTGSLQGTRNINTNNNDTSNTTSSSSVNNNQGKRQWLFWQLIHEILMIERGNTKKWEKLGELRTLLGEALQPSMEHLGCAIPDKLKDLLEEWEEYDVFGGPSLMSQIWRLYQNKDNTNTNTNTDHDHDQTVSSNSNNAEETVSSVVGLVVPPVETSDFGGSTVVVDTLSIGSNNEDPSSESESVKETSEMVDSATNNSAPSSSTTTTIATGGNKDEQKKMIVQREEEEGENKNHGLVTTTAPSISYDEKVEKETQVVSKSNEINTTNKNQENSEKSLPSPTRRNPSLSLNQQIEYDFESKGVNPGIVESREFLDPCKAITTLQIARDIRTNTAVEISTALANLPSDVYEACEDLKSGKLEELDTTMTNDFSIRIPSNLIDFNIDEEASNLTMYQDIVQRQQKAREKLIYLLLKSRCQFGSMEAARGFYEMDHVAESLKKRKEMLSDALELEGLDTSEIFNSESSSTESSQTKKQQQLEPLLWYNPKNDDDITEELTETKKQRTE